MTNPVTLDDGYQTAIALLRNGGIVAVPTETVYGLAADATNAEAVAKIFAAKGRPSFNPLIAHVSGLAMARKVGEFDQTSLKLADAFWPGPLTLVVPLNPDYGIAEPVTAGLDTIALRHPAGVMAQLACDLDGPLAAPSANSSGRISPTRAQHVADDLGSKVDLVLDGGPCRVGLESTIVKCSDAKVTLLREGGISRAELEAVVGSVTLTGSNSKIEAPGMMLAHYAPAIPVRLNATSVEPDEVLLAFGSEPVAGRPMAVLNLSATGDTTEAAHNLFAMLKLLDGHGAKVIAVQKVPKDGLGAAINDRLKRAAAGSRQKETP